MRPSGLRPSRTRSIAGHDAIAVHRLAQIRGRDVDVARRRRSCVPRARRSRSRRRRSAAGRRRGPSGRAGRNDGPAICTSSPVAASAFRCRRKATRSSRGILSRCISSRAVAGWSSAVRRCGGASRRASTCVRSRLVGDAAGSECRRRCVPVGPGQHEVAESRRNVYESLSAQETLGRRRARAAIARAERRRVGHARRRRRSGRRCRRCRGWRRPPRRRSRRSERRSGQRELLVAAARALSRHADRGLAGREDARGPRQARRESDAAAIEMRAAASRGLADDRRLSCTATVVAERRRRRAGASPARRARDADDPRDRSAPAADRRAWASPASLRARRARATRPPPVGIRGPAAEAVEHAQARRAYVVGSGTVGPDPMTLRSSPTTSEMASVSDGPRAAAASQPPLTRDRCLRTVFSAWMSAPAFSSPSVASRLSREASAPSAGSGQQRRGAARQQHHEALVAPRASRPSRARDGRPPTLPLVGYRMPAEIPFERRRAGSAASCGPTTMPRGRGRRRRANAAAIAGAAFPAAMTRSGRGQTQRCDVGAASARSSERCRHRPPRPPRGRWRGSPVGGRARRRVSSPSWDRTRLTAPSRRRIFLNRRLTT